MSLAIALQAAAYRIFTSNTAIMALVNGRIYDRVPESKQAGKAAYPYITIGDDDIRDDSNTCFTESASVLMTVHVFSQAVGKVEAKTIGDLVKRALNTEIEIDDFETVAGGFLTETYRPLTDGLTTEGVLVFEYLTDPVTA